MASHKYISEYKGFHILSYSSFSQAGNKIYLGLWFLWITVYTRWLDARFYLEYGLYFACGLYAQHTQRDKDFAWAITEFQPSSRTANVIWQWAKVGRYHVPVKIRWHLRQSTVLIEELPSSDKEDFLGFGQ